MADTSGPPRSFWVVATGALLWNLLGVLAYMAQVTMSDEALAALSEAERALYGGIPAWATGAFAVAVFAGVLASALLLARKALAFPLFILSLVGILTQQVHGLFLSSALEVLGPGALALPLFTLLVGIFLVWYAGRAAARGWLR